MRTTFILPLFPALLLMIFGAFLIGITLSRRDTAPATPRPRHSAAAGLLALIQGILATAFLAALAVGLGFVISRKVLPHFGIERPGLPMSPVVLETPSPLGPIAHQLEAIERDLEQQVGKIGHLGHEGMPVGPALDQLRRRIQADRQYLEYLLKQNELARTNQAFRRAAAQAETQLRLGMARLRELEQEVETQRRQAEMMAERAYVPGPPASSPESELTPDTSPAPPAAPGPGATLDVP